MNEVIKTFYKHHFNNIKYNGHIFTSLSAAAYTLRDDRVDYSMLGDDENKRIKDMFKLYWCGYE